MEGKFNDVIIAIISAIGGGGLTALFTFRINNRKQDESEFTSLVNEYKSLVEDYKNEVEKLRLEVDKLKLNDINKELEIKELQHQLVIFESSHFDIPKAMWLKDRNGMVIFINPAYENEILKPINKTKRDYIGKTDIQFWGEEIGKGFKESFNNVVNTKKPKESIQQLEIEGKMYEYKVLEFPRFLNDIVVGVGGIILDYKQKK